jgi:menaquinone-9 beta-reductase
VFDVVIVGARCAGSPLATMLARHGLWVCLLDRSAFPTETPSTHVIQPCGVQILDDLGVLHPVLVAGAVVLRRFTMVNEDVRIEGTIEPPHFPMAGLCVRRITLDALLVEAAVQAGVEVRTGCRVTGVIRDDGGPVTGVQTEQGDVHSRLVVGADGRHSIIAESTGAAEYLVTPQGRVPAWAYFDNASDWEGRLRIGRQGDLAFLASPTDGGLYMAGIAIDSAKQREFHTDRDRYFTNGLAGWPELADLLADAKRVGPIRMMTNWHGYFRQSAGPGWVLVGDAGHFKDFTPAQGIADALRQAQQLAEMITSSLDSSDLDAQLQRWWRWRDQDAYEMYWLARDMGVPGVSSPLITSVLRGIADDETATQQLLRVFNHELPPSKLFTASRMAKAASRALRQQPSQIPATMREIACALKDEIYRAARRYTTRPGRIRTRPRRRHRRGDRSRTPAPA